ncbi:hypothetical protein M433DRAFT_155775 [Acidomyces richmondensis BFW]|nr:MAG: hypothetical protein FE78DRAFT_87871 [Acidomyces sp. 'richmondensis']KYG44295.1 hypothetical protein M433DRAFT_155775 [Acidomyces richmondensis BFW]
MRSPASRAGGGGGLQSCRDAGLVRAGAAGARTTSRSTTAPRRRRLVVLSSSSSSSSSSAQAQVRDAAPESVPLGTYDYTSTYV